MNVLLAVSRLIDAINARIGRSICWLILLMVVISTLNALARKLFSVGSNAFLEIQWYLFAAVFLLGAGSTLLRNEHVRIDVISSHLSIRVQLCIELIGTLIFLLPLCSLVLLDSWPYFLDSWTQNEYSPNPGGLLVWPVKLLIPLGFALLAAQGVSQLIKVIGALCGRVDPATLLKGAHPATGHSHGTASSAGRH